MANEIRVGIGLDTTQYEAGLRRMVQLTQSGVAQIGQTVTQSVSALSNLGKVSQTIGQQWQNLGQVFGTAMGSIVGHSVNASVALTKAGASMTSFGESMFKAIPGAQALDNALQHFGLSFDKISKAAGPAALFGAMIEGIKAAGDFEDAFAQVRMQVEFVSDESSTAAEKFHQLEEAIHKTAAETGIATQALIDIAAEAGKLGIQGVDDISKFTETINKLAVVSGMNNKALASSFSELAIQMGDTLDNADRMASTLVYLGNHSRATQAQILDMASSISGLAKFIGLTTPEVMGLASAFASFGAQPMAINRFMVELTKAAREGGGALDLLANVAGKTSKELQSMLQNGQGAEGIVAIFRGLKDGGDQAALALERLGLGNQRTIKTMLLAADAMGLFNKDITLLEENLNNASDAWDRNNDLQKEFAERIATTWAQIKILGETVEVVLIQMFSDALGPIKAVVETLTGFFTYMKENHPIILRVAGDLTLLVAALTAVAIGMAALLVIIGSVVGALGTVALAIGTTTAALTVLIATFGTAVLIVGSLVAGLAILEYKWGAISKAMKNFSAELGADIGGINAEVAESIEKSTNKAMESQRAMERSSYVSSGAVMQYAETVKKNYGLMTEAQIQAFRTQDAYAAQSAQFQESLAQTKAKGLVDLGQMTQRELINQQEDESNARIDEATRHYEDEKRLAEQDVQNKQKLLDAANLAYDKALDAEFIKREELSNQREKLDKEDEISYNKTIVAQLDATEKVTDAVMVQRQKLSESIEDFANLTDAQKTFAKIARDLQGDLLEANKAKEMYVVGSQEYTDAVNNETKAYEKAKLATDAYLRAIGAVSKEEALRITQIEYEQKVLDQRIKNNELLLNADKVYQQQKATLMQQAAIKETNFGNFVVATTRKYVAESANIWQGFGQLITNTFDNIQRNLSDAFFDFFKTGTFDMKKLWKSMLDSFLRDLSNFMAQQVLREFLGILVGTAPGGPGGAAGTGGGGIISGLIDQLLKGGSSGSGGGSGGLIGGLIGGIGGLIGGGGGGGGGSSPVPDVPNFDWGDFFSSGGPVRGSGSGDTVPAMLEPGEYVVRKDIAAQIAPALNRMHGYNTVSSGRMATGGQVSLAGLSGMSLGQFGMFGSTTQAQQQQIIALLQALVALQAQANAAAAATAAASQTSAAASALTANIVNGVQEPTGGSGTGISVPSGMGPQTVQDALAMVGTVGQGVFGVGGPQSTIGQQFSIGALTGFGGFGANTGISTIASIASTISGIFGGPTIGSLTGLGGPALGMIGAVMSAISSGTGLISGLANSVVGTQGTVLSVLDLAQMLAKDPNFFNTEFGQQFADGKISSFFDNPFNLAPGVASGSQGTAPFGTDQSGFNVNLSNPAAPIGTISNALGQATGKSAFASGKDALDALAALFGGPRGVEDLADPSADPDGAAAAAAAADAAGQAAAAAAGQVSTAAAIDNTVNEGLSTSGNAPSAPDATDTGPSSSDTADGYGAGGEVRLGRMRKRYARDTIKAHLEAGEFIIPRALASGNMDRLTRFLRSGSWPGGKQMIRLVPMSGAGAGNEQASPVAGGGSSQNISIGITVNGNVDDPHEFVQRVAPLLRDELKRIDPRYSRAGNKTQV